MSDAAGTALAGLALPGLAAAAPWTAFGLGLAAASQPGPFQAFLVARTLRDGAARTWPLAFGPLLSDGVVAAVALSLLATAPDAALRVLAGLGAIAVAALAWESGRSLLASRPADRPTPDAPPDGVRGGLLRAALVNVLNPAPWTFWALVLGPLAVAAWARGPAHGVAVVAAFYAALVGGGVALVVAFGAAARLGARVRTALRATSTVALAGFAVLLAVRALGL